MQNRACWNVRLWDLKTGETHLLDVGEGAAPIEDLEFTPDGRLLVASADSLRLWNVEERTYELIGELGKGCSVVELSRDGRTAACISGEQRAGPVLYRAFVYDIETGARRRLPPLESSQGHDELWDIAIDPTGTLVATGDETGSVRVGPVTGGEPHLLLGHEGVVTAVAFSPDGEWIASAGADHTVRLWPVPKGRPLHTLPYNELLEKLRSLTNVRVVPDEDSSTGYRIDFEPFPGFAKVPVW